MHSLDTSDGRLSPVPDVEVSSGNEDESEKMEKMEKMETMEKRDVRRASSPSLCSPKLIKTDQLDSY